MRPQFVLFYDGVCGLCQGLVQFVLKRDKAESIHFAPLQGTTARESLDVALVEDLNTVVVLKDGKVYRESQAILLLLGQLPYPWKLLGVFRIVPSFIGDAVYRAVSRSRYQIFGKTQECWFLPGDSRFLD